MEAIIETVRGGATPTETIDRILTLARRQLGMDVAFVSAIENGLAKVRATEGDAESFGLDGGIAIPLEESYCNLMVKGGASEFRQLFRPVGNGESSNERSR